MYAAAATPCRVSGVARRPAGRQRPVRGEERQCRDERNANRQREDSDASLDAALALSQARDIQRANDAKTYARPMATCYRAALTLAQSSSGNGNLRPETLGAPRREKFSQRAKPTAETGSPRAGYGNVALFLTLGNHVGLRGLPGPASARATADADLTRRHGKVDADRAQKPQPQTRSS